MKTTLLHCAFVWFACLFLACWEARAQTPTWQWAKLVGNSPRIHTSKSSVVDTQGNLYVAASFEGTLTLGNTSVVSKGNMDVFFAKYSPCGELIWVKTFGGISQDVPNAINIDAEDNIYLLFRFVGSGTIDNQLEPQNDNFICLTKYKPDGTMLWYRLLSENTWASTILVDSEQQIYLYGNIYGNTKFGNTVYPVVGTSSIFLAKYDALGQFQTVQFFPTLGGNNAGSASITTNGDIYVTGNFAQTINIKGTLLQPTAPRTAFCAALKKNGESWAKRIELSLHSDLLANITIDETDEMLYFCGHSLKGNGTIDYPHEFDSTFIAKYDILGNKKWVRKSKKYFDAQIFIGDDNKVYTAFGFFSAHIFYSSLSGDITGISQLDKEGNRLWEKRITASNSTISFGDISFKDRHNIYVRGQHWRNINTTTVFFDDIELSLPQEGYHLFIAKLGIKDTALPASFAGSDLSLCSHTQGQLGSPPLSNYSYSWLPTDGLSNPNIANPTVSLENNANAPIVKQYIVKASDMTCPNAPLTKYDTVKVTVLPAYKDLKIFTGSPVVCPNTSGTKYWINAKPNYDFAWSVSGGSIESGQGTDTIRVAWQNPNPNAWVEVRVKHKTHGCETVFKLPIVVDNLLKPNKPVGESAFCIEPEKVFVYKTSLLNNGSTYLWKTDDNTAIWVGANNQSEVKIRWTTAGIKKLWVVETNQTPCLGSSEMLEINVLPTPTPIDIRGATPIPFFASQVRYEVQASTGATYQWTLAQGGKITEGQGSPAIRIDWEQEGEYLLTVQETNSSGCVGMPAEMHIKVVPFLPPNVITPNGDGKNDTWFLAYIENFPAHKVQIFDHAGKLVHQSNAYKNDWDASGLPTDVYFYYLTLHPKIKPFKGTITVIR